MSQVSARIGTRAAIRWRDLIVPVLLFVVALAVRIPHFATIPAPTDETDELLVALSIYRDGEYPLTTSEPYLGPLFVYLIALAYALLGPTFTAARVVALISGALVVPATWALGRAFGRSGPGLVGASLVLLAFGPVVAGSHIAWSHGAAPTMVAAALSLLVWASRGVAPRATSLGAGLLAGLAVGAHPTVLTLLPGAAAWWIMSNRALLGVRLRACIWIGAGLLIASSPNLIYLLLNGLGPFRERIIDQGYVGTQQVTWIAGVAFWIMGLAQNAAGPAQFGVSDPRIWVACLLIVFGLTKAVRHPLWLFPAVVGSGSMLMPLLVDGDRFMSLTSLRYTAPALPVAAVAIGFWLDGLWESANKVQKRAIAFLLASILVVQGWSVLSFYEVTIATGVSGEPVIAVVDDILAEGGRHDAILLDHDIDTKLLGGGEVGRAADAMLTLSGSAYTVAKIDKIRWFLVNGNGATFDMILAGNTADALSAEFALKTVRVVSVVPGQISRTGDHWGWYRYTTAEK